MATMLVYGAGSSEANGTYTEFGTYSGKPRYIKAGNWEIIWVGFGSDRWYIENYTGATTTYYMSLDNVATPDLVTTWQVVGSGALPLPTVGVKLTAWAYDETYILDQQYFAGYYWAAYYWGVLPSGIFLFAEKYDVDVILNRTLNFDAFMNQTLGFTPIMNRTLSFTYEELQDT